MLHIEHAFDPNTSTLTYLIEHKGECAIIDSVLDFDAASGKTSTASAEHWVSVIQARGWTCRYLLETHVHADHLSAAPWLKAQLGGEIVVGKAIIQVQRVFGALFNTPLAVQPFDRLVSDKERLTLGEKAIRVLHTPGHTPACLSYVVDDAAFVGDTLFMPDYGTARCDFPGGDAATLWHSIQKILSLPDSTRIFTGHDYAPGGRPLAFESTVKEQRENNLHLQEGFEAFVAMRSQRDATLAMPKLMLPSVQVNMRAGHMPEPEDNGVAYLKIPLNAL